jgi:hypothetical protein
MIIILLDNEIMERDNVDDERESLKQGFTTRERLFGLVVSELDSRSKGCGFKS